jgi:hypothetical protein
MFRNLQPLHSTHIWSSWPFILMSNTTSYPKFTLKLSSSKLNLPPTPLYESLTYSFCSLPLPFLNPHHQRRDRYVSQIALRAETGNRVPSWDRYVDAHSEESELAQRGFPLGPKIIVAICNESQHAKFANASIWVELVRLGEFSECLSLTLCELGTQVWSAIMYS